MKILVDRFVAFNLAEAAKEFGVSKTTVKNWLDYGAPGFKRGDEWEINPGRLLDWRVATEIARRTGNNSHVEDFEAGFHPGANLDRGEAWPGEINPAQLRDAARRLRAHPAAGFIKALADYLDADRFGKGDAAG